MKQQLYLESRFGYPLSDGSYMFWLQDSLVIPNPREYQFEISVRECSIPLTNYVIANTNNVLEIVYDTVSSSISLPLGNYSIDSILSYVNTWLSEGFVVSYSENTNKITFASDAPNARLEIGPKTTCGALLGIIVGESSIEGSYEAPNGVNLAGTPHFFVRSNLRTRNRDPVSLGYSNIIAKIPITRSFNGVEKYSSYGSSFAIQDRTIDYIAINMLDENMQPVKFNGGHWSMTIEFSVVHLEDYSQPLDYRMLIENGQIGNPTNVANDQRQDQSGVRPK